MTESGEQRLTTMPPSRVLMTDPSLSLLITYRDALRRDGFEVATAANGLECVETLRSFVPHVLVLGADLLWGNEEGILAMMREDPGLSLIPTVFLMMRVHRDVDYLHRMAASPVCRMYLRPVAPHALADSLRRILDEYSLR